MQHGRVIPGLNLQDFQNLISDWGVVLVHYRALPAPSGRWTSTTRASSHHNHSGCQNGFIFDKAGEVTCLFMGNGTQVQILDTGQYFGSTVNVTFPPVYDDNPETSHHRAERPARAQGAQGLRRREPALHRVGQRRGRAPVPRREGGGLIDSDGRQLRQDSDFTLKDGAIQWTGAARRRAQCAPSATCTSRSGTSASSCTRSASFPTQDPVTGVREMSAGRTRRSATARTTAATSSPTRTIR
jgi:hypothetical protein